MPSKRIVRTDEVNRWIARVDEVNRYPRREEIRTLWIGRKSC